MAVDEFIKDAGIGMMRCGRKTTDVAKSFNFSEPLSLARTMNKVSLSAISMEIFTV